MEETTIYNIISQYLYYYNINDCPDTVRQNIVEELNNNKNEYLKYIYDDNFLYDEYIQNIKDDDTFWNYTIAVACAKYYNINIAVSDSMHIFIDEEYPINVYLYQPKIKEKSEKLITAFDDPLKFNCQHPLKYKWDLWVDNKIKAKSDNWLDTIKKIISVNTIENFWGVFNNIPTASDLNAPSDYYLFKENIIPCWEDVSNINGGKMTIVLKKQKDRVNYELLDNIWSNTVLAAIGENFNSDLITGIVLNIRKHQDRINIWISSSEESKVIEIGTTWKNILDIKNPISFIKHDDNSINYII